MHASHAAVRAHRFIPIRQSRRYRCGHTGAGTMADLEPADRVARNGVPEQPVTETRDSPWRRRRGKIYNQAAELVAARHTAQHRFPSKRSSRVSGCGTLAEHTSDIADEMISLGSLILDPDDACQAQSASSSTDELMFSARPLLTTPVWLRSARECWTSRQRCGCALKLRRSSSTTNGRKSLSFSKGLSSMRRSVGSHGDLGGFRALVEGVARNFAIKRDFEGDLWKIFETTLHRLSQSDGVLSSSWTVRNRQKHKGCASHLEVRRQLRLPVLVATSRVPTYADVDAFF